jgi:hypothetical protein
MQEIVTTYLDQIKIGDKQVYKNLALFPLLSNLDPTSGHSIWKKVFEEQPGSKLGASWDNIPGF